MNRRFEEREQFVDYYTVSLFPEDVCRTYLPSRMTCSAVHMGNENDEKDDKDAMAVRLLSSSSFDDEDECQEECGAVLERAVGLCPHKMEGVCSFLSLPRTTQLLFEFESGRAVPRLREPRHLYGSSGHASHALLRWPRECEVIPEEICHIEWAPPLPEPLCAQRNTDTRLQVPEGRDGIVVYDAGGEKERFFCGSRLGGRRAPLRDVAVSLTGPDDVTLLFEARFESGNLLRALRVGEYDYELTLRTDLYTERHTQWFYFRVKNTRAGVRYRFTISNLLKVSSLYEEGLRPLLYSEEKARAMQVGWHRAGQEVTYCSNGHQHVGQPCYSLSWVLSFPYDRDTCYLAHCYPYTYSNLRAHLAQIEGDPARSRFCKVRTLCHSLAGNLVPVLTVTNPEAGGARKPAVVVTARVHPGETNSSWVMKGILDFLLGDSPDATLLRDSFVFKLVPMLNPDGVIVGNSRCSLTGCDMNRSYRSILRESFPPSWAMTAMIQRLCKERTVLLYCDLHGHSRKQNVFIYGCENPRLAQKHPHGRVFPLMLSKNCPDMFSFQNCKFKMQRSKEGTGRVALWRLGALNSFTLETSLCGSDVGQRKGTHFSTHDLEMLGVHFCDTLLDYCDPNKTKYSACMRELQEMLRQEAVPPVGCEPRSKDANASSNGQNARSAFTELSGTSGSSSSESDELPVPVQSLNEVGPRKKALRSIEARNRALPPREKMAAREPELAGERIRQTLEKNKYEVNSAECLEHLMADYRRSRMQLGLRPALSGVQLSKSSKLPPLPLAERTVGRLSPVDWNGPKAHTAPASLEIRSNRLKPLRLKPLRGRVHGGAPSGSSAEEDGWISSQGADGAVCGVSVKYAKKKKWKITDETQTQERRKPFDSNILKAAKKTTCQNLTI